MSVLPTNSLTIGQCATLACLLEATAPKVGNVHRGADFPDLTFTDFAVSAVLIGPAMEAASVTGVGRAVLDAIAATRERVTTNTNLGMVLLLAPLAAVPRDKPLLGGVDEVLAALSPEDCRLVYEAIRLAQPGGLGQVEQMDVHGPPPDDLIAAMRLAAGRDLVAGQYVDGFHLVLHEIAPRINRNVCQNGWTLTDTIIRIHLELLAQHEDSLIVRKSGREMAQRVSRLAEQVLDAGGPGDETYEAALADLDFYLRADGNKRNPGTTADLIAAALFVVLREGTIQPPFR
jgi:triphosphoribosyl-dephospho-CoA synthase